VGIFALFADPGIQYLPPYRNFFLVFSLKEHSPVATLCFSSVRNRSVIFTRFVAHYIELNGGWLLQAPKTIGNDL